VQLVAGGGDDDETYDEGRIWVYDSNVFPFHQAELYHQFHDYDGRMGKYKAELLSSGRLRKLACPSEFVALLSSPVIICLLVALGLCCCCIAFSKVRQFIGSSQRRDHEPDHLVWQPGPKVAGPGPTMPSA